MPLSDLDIHRAAHLWIDTSLRITAAIGTLGAPPTDSWH
jgi:hypothetical protein